MATRSSHPFQGITALCLFGLVVSTHAGTHQIEGRTLGVHDGDTITLLDADNRQHKITLDGIDAPELGQPFGWTSKQHLDTADSHLDTIQKTELHTGKTQFIVLDGLPRIAELTRAVVLMTMANGWTSERRAKQAEIINTWDCGSNRPARAVMLARRLWLEMPGRAG